MASEQHANGSYYDMFDDEIAFTPLSPQFFLDDLESGHATTPSNRTTLASRGAPTYWYPNAVTTARAGSRLIATAGTTTTSNTSSLHQVGSSGSSPSPALASPPSVGIPSSGPTPASSYTNRPVRPYGFHQGLGWTSSSGSSSLYNSGSDNSSSTNQLFDFHFPGHERLPPTSASYGGEFVSPGSMHQPSFSFSRLTPNPWHESSEGTSAAAIADAGASVDISSAIPATVAGGEATAQVEPLSIFGSPPPPSRASSSRRKRAKKSTSSGVGETGSSPGATTASVVSPDSLASTKSAASSVAATSVSGGGNKSKLRSASRTSKNTYHKPAETLEERRTRASHNLVEKQYRNRLNTQFESLLGALPEIPRSADGEDGDRGADGERRVSKAEVLDMARRHIKQLEKEREDLESERDQLLGSMEKLKDSYIQRISPPDATGIVPMLPPEGTSHQDLDQAPYDTAGDGANICNGPRGH